MSDHGLLWELRAEDESWEGQEVSDTVYAGRLE